MVSQTYNFRDMILSSKNTPISGSWGSTEFKQTWEALESTRKLIVQERSYTAW